MQTRGVTQYAKGKKIVNLCGILAFAVFMKVNYRTITTLQSGGLRQQKITRA